MHASGLSLLADGCLALLQSADVAGREAPDQVHGGA